MLKVEYTVSLREVEVRLNPENPMDVEVARMMLRLDGNYLPLTVHPLENGGLALRKSISAASEVAPEPEYFDKSRD